jgi:hypothetical protein
MHASFYLFIMLKLVWITKISSSQKDIIVVLKQIHLRAPFIYSIGKV